ncbi:hypothetical protein BC628DRAFT_1414440 [Trametes gibbosa]|nr:hypothetical protein BC628DRAFT_42930 [Trametes gibbosa]KAI0833700.1 hypothetical protein BC628DRAFT_1414440 [Trametes gibbosa]
MSAPQLTIVLHAPTSPTPASPAAFSAFSSFAASCGPCCTPIVAFSGSPGVPPSWPAAALPDDQYLPLPENTLFKRRRKTRTSSTAKAAKTAKTKPVVTKVSPGRGRRLPDPWKPTVDPLTGQVVLVPVQHPEDIEPVSAPAPAPSSSISTVLAGATTAPDAAPTPTTAPAAAPPAIGPAIGPALWSTFVGYKNPGLVPTIEWAFYGLMSLANLSLFVFF